MLSLLLAYFGKGKIPDGIRYTLMFIGICILLYRLNKLRKATQNVEKMVAINQVIQKKAAEAKAQQQQPTQPTQQTQPQPESSQAALPPKHEETAALLNA